MVESSDPGQPDVPFPPSSAHQSSRETPLPDARDQNGSTAALSGSPVILCPDTVTARRPKQNQQPAKPKSVFYKTAFLLERAYYLLVLLLARLVTAWHQSLQRHRLGSKVAHVRSLAREVPESASGSSLCAA